MEYIYAAAGLLLLFLAGDWLVRGAVSAGLRLHIPVIIIGLTIVAFGTSAPELFVTIQSSLAGEPGIAVGNVVGSNIANVLLVIGLPALLNPLGDNSMETKRNYLIMIGVTFIATLLILYQPLTVWHGIVLLGLLALFLLDTYRSSMASRRAALAAKAERANDEPDEDDEPDTEFEEISDADPAMPWWKIGAYVLAGMIGLPVGAQLTVDSAIIIAEDAGFSKEVIGLTLVAIGTSLPELATTVMAAVRGRADVAIGNVIGSNIFNLLAILGVASTLDRLTIDASFITWNLPVMVFAALVLAPFIWLHRDVGRFWGGIFVACYVAYIALALQPGGAA